MVSLNNDGWSRFVMGFHLIPILKMKSLSKGWEGLHFVTAEKSTIHNCSITLHVFRIVLDSIGSEVELKPLHMFTPFVSGGVKGRYSLENSRHPRCQKWYLRPRYGTWSFTWIVRLSESLNMHVYRTYLQISATTT